MATLLLTFSVFAFAMLIMAVGVIFQRPCLRGSCGGPEVLGADGESLSCATCPNRKKRRAVRPLPVVRTSRPESSGQAGRSRSDKPAGVVRTSRPESSGQAGRS